MSKSLRLEDKIRLEIQLWYDARGDDFIVGIKEFCQGNRTSLSNIMAMVKELSARVFVKEGSALNKELLESLEYGVFDLIGRFSSTPGEPKLLQAIQDNIVQHLTDIFTETKKLWNLNTYKITESYEELDPSNDLIPAPEIAAESDSSLDPEQVRLNARHRARGILDELVLFAKSNFRGEIKRKIAVNWLENPEKIRDFNWLSTLVGSSTGSTKVILTRIKHSFTKAYNLKRADSKLVLVHPEEKGSNNCLSHLNL